MDLYKRELNLPSILKQKSHFLFGARGTGKSTLIDQTLPDSKVFDLLDDEIYERLLRSPKIIEEVTANFSGIVVIDEIQRLPKLLNEVQRLMRKVPNTFLLTGSSARKLKKGASNLLGGRAWEAHLHPLTYREIDDFNLLKYLNYGGLPHVYLSSNPTKELRHYINLYLREEIITEALTRKMEYFISFLDTLSLANGEELRFQNISNDSNVPARTIQNYIQILEDTLIGFQLKPFRKTKKRKAIACSKFYFFDLGVVNQLAKRSEIKEGSELFGKAFEHFIIREVKSRLSYKDTDHELCYWRSTSQFEVDLIIGNKYAIEIKSTKNINSSHLKGLKALREEGLIEKYIVVSNDPISREIDGVFVCHWRDLFKNYFGEGV